MIGFVGLSHLGLVYSLASAARGFEVVAHEPDPERCRQLAEGRFPIEEPGLRELFAEHRARLHYTADVSRLAECDLVFVSLDVPTDENNQSDLGPLRTLVDSIRPRLAKGCSLVLLSQVRPGFTRTLAESADASTPTASRVFYQVETLVFGAAVERALHPERYIVGSARPDQPLPAPYRAWLDAFGCPVFVMRYESAELAKIAINLFLVSSVSTTNTLAELCEAIGADWSEIVPALRLDRRIGPHAYLVRASVSPAATSNAPGDCWALRRSTGRRARGDCPAAEQRLPERTRTPNPASRSPPVPGAVIAVLGIGHKPTPTPRRTPPRSRCSGASPPGRYEPTTRARVSMGRRSRT
jgi:nucleotide sugar dehydrogenase